MEENKADQMALKGEYREAVNILNAEIDKCLSTIKQLIEKHEDIANADEEGIKEYDEAHIIMCFYTLSRAKLYFLLGDNKSAYDDIEKVYSIDDEIVMNDSDDFVYFEPPSLKEICGVLQIEGYKLSFNPDEIEEYE
jgi:hypothetical protein